MSTATSGAAEAGPLDTVVRAAIHPAIGVARVGNSPEGYFIGPEVAEPASTPAGAVKDAAGALKRQAARFRIYGYDAAGKVVAELTADNAELTWTALVANKKAAWYQFQIALDIPEASAAGARESLRRNPTVTGANRAKLAIHPGLRTITGRNVSGPQYRCDTGTFLGRKVYLGEVRTDEAGRLIFLGGRGVSAPSGTQPIESYANNDGWHDDICDGGIGATVKIGGRAVPVDPAWVISAPPNYAPDLLSVRTMYDLLVDTFVTARMLPAPTTVSFTRDVLPILRRMCGLQWANYGFATRFGWGGPDDFLAPARLARLASKRPEHAELRHQVFSTFRDLNRDGLSPVPWPWVYGDAMSLPPKSARQHFVLSSLQYKALQRWAAGDFVADYDPAARPPRTLAEVPLAEQPAMLDRAALTFCVADAFHPGCELTWPMRHASMYRAPFRIKTRPGSQPEPDYGAKLTPQIALGANGPLTVQAPGDLTRWMAVPWQADTASCKSAYASAGQPLYDPYVPTFWPARVPNHVLTVEDYAIVTDPAQPAEARRAAFERRKSWFRGLRGTTSNEQRTHMVTAFGKMGVVEERPGVANSTDFPPRMLVELTPGLPVAGVAPLRNLRVVHVPEGAAPEALDAARRLAAEQVGVSAEDVTVDFDDKVARFSADGDG
jgi:hypothetical protein